jgi:hypothetical protein
VWLGIAPGTPVRCTDLWTGAPIVTIPSPIELRLAEGAVASWAENHAFLIELS